MPDDSQNPLGGAQALENRFEQSWQSGGADSQNPKEAAQLQAQRAEQNPTPAAAGDLPAAPAKADAKAATAAPNYAQSQDEPEYVNFDDYLQKAGIERESFLTLPVRIGEADIPLAEVLKRAETAQDFDTQTTALTARQQAFEAEQAQQKQVLQQRLTAAEQLGNIAYQELVREYQSVDWNSLSQTDPGRCALLQTQFQQRNAAIQNQLQQIEGQKQEQARQAQAQQLETLKGEQVKLLKAIPEWRDEGKFKVAREQMTQYGKKLGFNDEELNAIFDHRYMRVLHDAAQWNQLKSQQAAALKKVRAAPQISNPGARITRDPKVTAITEAKTAFHRNPKRMDAQLAFANRIAENI
jgi:hypothetical protein